MDVARLFGSRVRAEILLALAATPRPQSAYRLAQTAEAQPIQVLTILKELGPTVRRSPEGWSLQDPHLRQFLLGETRRRDLERRNEKDALLIELGLKPASGRGRH